MRSSCSHRSKAHQRQPSAAGSRAGFSIIELLTAGLLLGAVFALVVPTLRWIGLEQLAAEQRQLALLEAANLMDRLTSASWKTLTPEYASSITLPESAKEQLPQAELKVTIDAKPEAPEAKRIAIQLGWNDRTGKPTSPVRVTAWVYRRGTNG